jgi:hypothetical protein
MILIKKAATPTTDEKKQSDRNGAFFNKSGINLRNAVRYGRTKNTTELYSKRFFLATKPFPIQLLDISSRGAKIKSKWKLKINTDFVLKITFADSKTFEITGKVVRKDLTAEDCYGFKFNTYNDRLGEYLFKTQTELIFK